MRVARRGGAPQSGAVTSLTSESGSPRSAYESRLAAAERSLAALDSRSGHIANLRTVAFLGAVIVAGLVLFGRLPREHWWTAGGFALAFAALAAWHHRVYLREERERLRAELNRRGLMRLSEEWHRLPNRGERFADGAHLYTPDLDVFGQGSLFQLIDHTATRSGEERLASWLSQPASAETIRQRQGAVRELGPKIDFRQALAIEGMRVKRDKADAQRFIHWAEAAPSLEGVRWARVAAWILPPVIWVLFGLGRADVVDDSLWLFGVAATLAVTVLTRKQLGAFHASLAQGEEGFVRYDALFRAMESESFEDARLKTLQGGLSTEGHGAVSRALARFNFWLSFAELRRNQLFPLIHLVTLWDVHFLLALEGWRKRHERQVRGWFEALSETEALMSLATLAHDRPSFTFPELAEGGPRLEAEALGHPLLLSPVANDVALTGPAEALLVTGSNMSGKSTLLRAMGLNAVIALAGGPVSARRLVISPSQVLTSMRVKDSLERGVSYFYAEVQRLKAVLDAAKAADGRALFLLDEILLGTNTRERQLASREVLQLLLATGASGAVSTHDLSLVELAEEHPGRVRCVHFRDQLEGERMTFDYRLREGVVDTTNALRVMKLAGIPVAEST